MTESTIYRRIRITSNIMLLGLFLLIVVTIFLWSVGR